MTLRTVKLFGELGKRFGRVHRLAIESPAEAVRALCAIKPGFEQFVAQSDERGVAYKVINTGSAVRKLDELHHPTGEAGDVQIVPVLRGAKSSGLFQVILGAALIAASFIPGLQGLAYFGGKLIVSQVLFSVGVSLALGGVAQMLAPTPKALDPKENPQNTPSTQFNGAVNTTAQGQAVPVCYGRLIVGSAVLSAGIKAEGVKV